jgi:hypothetical protein
VLRRFGLWSVRRLLGGGGRSWLITWAALGGFRLARRVLRAKPRVERLRLTPGNHVTIDQLAISHRRQIRMMRAEHQAERKAERNAKRRFGR